MSHICRLKYKIQLQLKKQIPDPLTIEAIDRPLVMMKDVMQFSPLTITGSQARERASMQ
jgi:hypothetical protein